MLSDLQETRKWRFRNGVEMMKGPDGIDGGLFGKELLAKVGFVNIAPLYMLQHLHHLFVVLVLGRP